MYVTVYMYVPIYIRQTSNKVNVKYNNKHKTNLQYIIKDVFTLHIVNNDLRK